MKKKAIVVVAGLVLALLGVCAGVSSAAEYAILIDGNSTMASEDGNVGGTPYKLTDGSGMNGNGLNDDRSLLRWPYDYSPGHPSTWTNTTSSYPSEYQATSLLSGATNGKIGWITFDLGSVRELADLYFWNCNDGGGDRGISGFNLYVATNALNIPSAWNQDYSFSAGNGWTQYGDDDGDPATARYTMPEATGTPTLYDMTIEITNSANARYIGIEVLSNWGTALNRFGLAEFTAVVVDTDPPALQSLDSTHDISLSVDVNNPVTYTLTFSEDMNTYSVTTADFANASSSIAVDYITQTSDTTFEVVVTPTSVGNLQLQVLSNVTDWAGNPMTADATDVQVIAVGTDTAAPQVNSITNDRNNGPVAIDTPITYTITFNEYIDVASVTVADFVNAASTAAPITVNSVTPAVVPHIFTVVVTPTGIGDILLRIPSGNVSDASGNATAQNWDDGETMTVNNPGLVIYEPFEDSDPTLSGNTPGIGLTGTFTASGSVEANSLSYSEIITGFNKAIFNNQYWGASVDTSLSLLGLLNDGATLWFSAIIRTGSDVATNGDLGFALGTDRLNGGNNIPMSSGGNGLGVRFKNNTIRACHWSSNPNSIAGTGCGPNTVYFIVGKFEWGATNDTVTIYNVGTDLLLPAPASSFSVSVDQAQYDTISLGSKSVTAGFEHSIDEIRFGSTYESVIVLPPPAGTVLTIR